MVSASWLLGAAASGLPEGASVTDKVSTISAYISLDVCLTLALLHGKEVEFDGKMEDVFEFEKLALKGAFLIVH